MFIYYIKVDKIGFLFFKNDVKIRKKYNANIRLRLECSSRFIK